MDNVRHLKAIRWATAEAQRERAEFAEYINKHNTPGQRQPFTAVVEMWCRIRNRPQSDRYGDIKRTKNIEPSIRAIDYSVLSEDDWLDPWALVMMADHDRQLQGWFVQQIGQYHPDKGMSRLASDLVAHIGASKEPLSVETYGAPRANLI